MAATIVSTLRVLLQRMGVIVVVAYLLARTQKNMDPAIAAEIQQSFLPEAITQIEGFEIAEKSVIAKEHKGDFLEGIRIKKGTKGMMIADKSGTGIPSADIITVILDAVHSFCGNYPLSDNITLRVIRVN